MESHRHFYKQIHIRVISTANHKLCHIIIQTGSHAGRIIDVWMNRLYDDSHCTPILPVTVITNLWIFLHPAHCTETACFACLLVWCCWNDYRFIFYYLDFIGVHASAKVTIPRTSIGDRLHEHVISFVLCPSSSSLGSVVLFEFVGINQTCWWRMKEYLDDRN